MSRRAAVYRGLILIVALVAVGLAARTVFLEVQKARRYAAGEAAAEAGQWSEALEQFGALVEVAPRYRDASERLDQVVSRAIEAVPGSTDAPAEAALLRWLIASGDWATLADVLDRCAVTIPAGEFLMGSEEGRNDERPQRLVYLDAYEIDRYEVTNVQYERFLRATGRRPPPYWAGDTYPPGLAAFPVAGVTWNDATAYCDWIGRRLPTEAEWEKACRGTDGRVYPWGDGWDRSRANVDPSEEGVLQPRAYTEPGAVGWGDDWAPLHVAPAGPDSAGLRPVASYPEGVSPYGVMDMAGGVSEWVADWYNWDGYWDVPDRNPLVLEPRWNRGLRGSSWCPYGIPGWASHRSRCSTRASSHRSSPDARLGFRCARSVP